jgi:ribosomal protein L11 methyltransferase
MTWLEVRIDASSAGLEPLEAFLSAQGIDGIVIDDANEFRAFAKSVRPAWGDVDRALAERKRNLCRVTFYLQKNDAGFAKLAQVRIALTAFKKEHPEYGELLMTLEYREDVNWENGWKRFYRPMEIGERLLVVPAWDQVETRGRIPLLLDPGVTFGTGGHATTRMCLTALETRIRGGETVLDLGCGSGILFLAALKLGALRAFACDIDDKCPAVAAENAALNNIPEDSYTVRTGDILTDDALRKEIGSGYDVVLANLVSDVLLGLAPAVKPLLRPGGAFICSGILGERAVEVADGLRLAGLSILESRESEGWFCYVCR